MNLVQKLYRLGQQHFKGMSRSIDMQWHQIQLAKKLFAKNGLILDPTCSAMPEQYDVFKYGKQVGYLRLRHGEFTVDYPNCMQKEIYSAEPNGDGMFDDDERLNYLAKAMRAILKEIELDFKP